MNSKEKAYFKAKNKVKQAITPKGGQADEKGYYKDFTAYLQGRNIMDKNIKRYALQVEHFTNWLHTHKGKQPETCQKKDVLDFLHYLQEKRQLSASTRQHLLGMLRHYYTFLYQSGQTQTNPTLLIKLRGTKKKLLKKILSTEELDELLDTHYELKVRHAKEGKTNHKGQFQSSKHIQQRNHLILSLFVYQGLKRAELLSLTLDDIDLQKATIKVNPQPKTNARTLPLQAVQIGIFYEYLQQSRPLFPKENGLLINSKPELQKMMTDLRKLYPKFTDFLQLRSSIITHWIQTEGLRKAQYKAGHRYISSTEEYLANDLESLKDDINRFHPL